MREIKFRAWDKVKNRYVYDFHWLPNRSTVEMRGGTCVRTFRGSSIYHLKNTLDFYLEQYTGLKDKNGKEIYEGDIVSAEGMYNSCVVFNGGTFTPEGGDYGLSLEYQMEEYGWFEIIGNIHENKDLL